MSLITLIILVALIGIGFWANNAYVTPPILKIIINVVLFIILIILILRVAGIGNLGSTRIFIDGLQMTCILPK